MNFPLVNISKQRTSSEQDANAGDRMEPVQLSRVRNDLDSTLDKSKKILVWCMIDWKVIGDSNCSARISVNKLMKAP